MTKNWRRGTCKPVFQGTSSKTYDLHLRITSTYVGNTLRYAVGGPHTYALGLPYAYCVPCFVRSSCVFSLFLPLCLLCRLDGPWMRAFSLYNLHTAFGFDSKVEQQLQPGITISKAVSVTQWLCMQVGLSCCRV